MLSLALILLLTPLAGFLLQSAFGRRLPRQGDWLTIATIGTSLACALAIFTRTLGGEVLDPALASSGARWDWLRMGTTVWTVGVKIDGLTAVMLVVVTLVAFLVHVFSVGYMKGDPKYGKFFAWLQMFSVSMLMLVLADNLLTLFIGWELVGLCSYKLIGFWSEKKAPGNAARKAFITTRIGDLGMVAAIMLLYAQTHSFAFDAIFRAVGEGGLDSQVRTWASLGLFLAAMGKSAQFPLHVWLPDAMEGPTPVSALIHAATMVAAGVYLVGRMYPLFTPDAPRGRRRRRHRDRAHGRAHRDRAERHQEGARLLHGLPAGLHVRGARLRGLARGPLPPDDARLLQGADVPRLGQRDRRVPPRAGHAQDGGALEEAPDHRHDVLRRRARDRGLPLHHVGLLQQGRDPRGGLAHATARSRGC